MRRGARATSHRTARSPAAGRAPALALALAWVVALGGGSVARAGSPSADAQAAASASAPPSATAAAPASAADTDATARVRRAVAALRADPLLPGRHQERVLRFKDDAASAPQRSDDTGLLRWLGHLGDAIAGAGRLLVWGLGATVVAILLVTLRRLLAARADAARHAVASRSAVQRVGVLYVRPESLPEDVGATAWRLWTQGDADGALSLLYRGALSCLIHRHGVPILASSTEGECLRLARAHLAPAALEGLGDLVAAWQSHTYAGDPPATATVDALCRTFDTLLAPAGPAATPGSAP